jgi:hypothetical protein
MALEILSWDSLTIVCPGNARYPLDDRIHVRGPSEALRSSF